MFMPRPLNPDILVATVTSVLLSPTDDPAGEEF
jgi:hypothetical protein